MTKKFRIRVFKNWSSRRKVTLTLLFAKFLICAQVKRGCHFFFDCNIFCLTVLKKYVGERKPLVFEKSVFLKKNQ